jgi:hypothetical protein
MLAVNRVKGAKTEEYINRKMRWWTIKIRKNALAFVSPTGGVAIASSVMEADPSTVTPHPSPEISTIIEKKKKKRH